MKIATKLVLGKWSNHISDWMSPDLVYEDDSEFFMEPAFGLKGMEIIHSFFRLF